MVEDRDLAERMTLQMLGRFRIALEHIELHLFELSDALLGEDHLDRAHICGAVKAPEDNVGHDRGSFSWAVQASPASLERIRWPDQRSEGGSCLWARGTASSKTPPRL